MSTPRPTFTLALKPYVRVRGGQPLVVLTEPARTAICIEPEGQIEVASLCGVSATYGRHLPITEQQADTLDKLSRAGLLIVFGHGVGGAR